MKLIGISASPRGRDSNTLRLVPAVLAGAQDEKAETELVDLYSLRGKRGNPADRIPTGTLCLPWQRAPVILLHSWRKADSPF